jgi:putative drug exporter of the RND superfamily
MNAVFSRLAEFVLQRPVTILITWALLLAIAIPISSLVPERLRASATKIRGSQADLVSNLLEDRFGVRPVERTVLVSRSGLKSNDPKFLGPYAALIKKLETLDGVGRLTRFDAPSVLSLQSEDLTVTATILETRRDQPEPVIDAIRREAQAAKIPDTQLLVTGSSAVTHDFIVHAESDTKQSELTALPLTGLVLVLAFGALVAACVPLVVGASSITITLALLYPLTQIMVVSSFAQSVITLLGLGAGIDYALLMVNRFREELAAGLPPRAAAAQTIRTAGRSIAFSGLTVMIALTALLVPDHTFVRSMGIGGIAVVMITVLASITAVPAALALLGDRINSPRRFAFQLTSGAQISPFWGSWADRVMRRPWTSSLTVIALLLALAWPATGMRFAYTGAFGLTDKIESRRGLELIRPLELGGAIDTFELIMDLGRENAFDAQTRSQFRTLDAALSRWSDVRLVISPFLVARSDFAAGGLSGGLGDLAALSAASISRDRRYLHLGVVPKSPVHPTTIRAWENRLRLEAQRAGFGQVFVGGNPINNQEFSDVLTGSFPLAVAFVFVATFILLAIAFRSILIPLKAILVNALTVSSAYGVLTLIFQHGWLAGFFGVPADTNAIDSTLPLLMFAVTFGLSMDYEIFLLSRIQEAHHHGLSIHAAVRSGLERSAGVITSAAAIMLIVFAAFIRGDVVANKAIGIGLAVAVLLDATLVRLVLVPAIMVMAGGWNWWLPAPLKRLLPRIKLEG